jgi:hypothetical protein
LSINDSVRFHRKFELAIGEERSDISTEGETVSEWNALFVLPESGRRRSSLPYAGPLAHLVNLRELDRTDVGQHDG